VDAFAVGRVAVERGRRHVRAPSGGSATGCFADGSQGRWPFVAHQDPEPSSPGFAQARSEHRHGGVVGVQRGAGPDVAADRLGQGHKREHRLSDPVGQRRAVEVHALPRIDPRLAVQRQVVAALRRQHMRDQPRPGPAALDGQRRHRLLHDRLAGSAAQLRPDMADHLEAGGHILEPLALVLPHPAEHRAAAARTGAGRLVGDRLARQMRRQRLAHRLLALARPGLGLPGGIGGSGAGVALGLLLLKRADQQLELLDVAVELLRRPAKPRTPQHGQPHLQLLGVQRLGVDLGVACGDLDVFPRPLRLQARGERPQRVRIGGQSSARQGHSRIIPEPAFAIQPSVRSASGQTATGVRGATGATVRRPSIASISRPSCAGVSTIPPSTIGGHTNLPACSRLANRHRPVPSHYKHFR